MKETDPTTLALEIVDLHARYGDGTVALRGVNLSVKRGERVALLGASGSGKTSLLLAIMGALSAERGRVTVDGLEVRPGMLSAVRRRCGMVFQEADDQLFMPTLLEDVAFGPLNHGVAEEQAVHQAREVLAEVGLAGLELKGGHHLSGGQKRAASLATVLSMQVELLLLDEPTANLDARGRNRLKDLLRKRSETLLLATHDLPVAQAVCDRAVIISEGVVAADAPAAEVFANHALLAQHGLM